MKAVVVFDPSRGLPIGTVLEGPAIVRYVAEGCATLPISEEHIGEHPLAPWSYWPQGQGCKVPTGPGRVLQAALFLSVAPAAKVAWIARVRFEGHAPNGHLRLSPDSAQAGSLQAPLVNDPAAVANLDGLELDRDGCLLASGSCAVRPVIDHYAGLCLTGAAFGATVLWAALSQTG